LSKDRDDAFKKEEKKDSWLGENEFEDNNLMEELNSGGLQVKKSKKISKK